MVNSNAFDLVGNTSQSNLTEYLRGKAIQGKDLKRRLIISELEMKKIGIPLGELALQLEVDFIFIEKFGEFDGIHRGIYQECIYGEEIKGYIIPSKKTQGFCKHMYM